MNINICVMDYFELTVEDRKDAFGESTDETALVLRIKDGYVFEPDKETVLRVNYSYVTMKYPEGTEKLEVPTEDIENHEWVVKYESFETDRIYTDFDRETEVCLVNDSKYEESGYICDTQIVAWEISKVSGKIIAYDLNGLEALFPTDKEGYRNVSIWYDKKYSYNEKFDSKSEDWEHAYWYEIIYNFLDHIAKEYQ